MKAGQQVCWRQERSSRSWVRDSNVLASILILPEIARYPNHILEKVFLRPMRLAVKGTMDAGRAALANGLAINLQGGFHHARFDCGEGFCAFADVIVALRDLKQSGLLQPDDRVLYVDLDAHRGNGVASLCERFRMDDVFILDAFCDGIYPLDPEGLDRIDHALPLAPGTSDRSYLDGVIAAVRRDIDDVKPSLVVYYAGSDILFGDGLGGLTSHPVADS